MMVMGYSGDGKDGTWMLGCGRFYLVEEVLLLKSLAKRHGEKVF